MTTTPDPYTTEARLCDDNGMVSDQPVNPFNVFAHELTYLKQLNNLRAHTDLPPYTGEPFLCTGSAHLAREHIRCTSPAHTARATKVEVGPLPARISQTQLADACRALGLDPTTTRELRIDFLGNGMWQVVVSTWTPDTRSFVASTLPVGSTAEEARA